jgi:hypothetical protein
MTRPPEPPPEEFGPTGEVPPEEPRRDEAAPEDTQRVAAEPDLTQRVAPPPDEPPWVPYAQPDMTQPVSTARAARAEPWADVAPSPPRPAEPDAMARSAAWAQTAAADDGNARRVLTWFAVGSLVTVALGVYGGVHDPSGQALNLAGFSSGLHAKAWLTTAAFALAIVQVLTASAMWGRLPGVRAGGRGVGTVHRWSGRAAVVVSLPVAAHCLYALGFQGYDTRVLVHSLLGCFFYGVFVCKMLALSRDHRPGWLVPALGGAVFTGLTGLWLTSALWFFTETGVSW